MITWGTLVATLLAPIVMVLPGWTLLALMLPQDDARQGRMDDSQQSRMDVAARLALAASLTVAVVPIALLLFHLIGFQVGTAAVLAILALCVLVLAWRQWRTGRVEPRSWIEHFPRPDAPLLALALGVLLLVGVRLWVVRGVDVGLWGDSFNHTTIVQLLLDNGGLFDSWEPYAPLQTFTYHFGFHGNVAYFQWAAGWLSGNATPRTVVLVGQFLNALAVLALYPLALRLGGSRWLGVVSVLVAGLLTPMPMYYVNWGRYTQLAGQVILPAAIWLTMEALEAPRRDPRRLALAVLATAGLALTHYFVLAFYVAFLAPYLVVRLLARWGHWPAWRETLLRTGIVGLLSILLILPWILNLLEGFLPQILVGWVQGTPPEEQIQTQSAFFPLAQFVPLWLAAAAGLGGLWAAARRRATALLLLWTGCLFLISNPYWLGLPGTGVINNFTVELALYIPVSILAADLAVSVYELARRSLPRLRPALSAATIVLLLTGALWGLARQKDSLAPAHQIVTPADEAAMTWVRNNTPQDAVFLINSFFAYGGSLIAGSDAGWWLPLLADRQNTVPPLNYGSEAGPDSDYVLRVNDVTRHLEQVELGDAETAHYLKDQGISYVFIGEMGGPLLDPAVLQASDNYQAVYTPAEGAAGPWVFEVMAP